MSEPAKPNLAAKLAKVTARVQAVAKDGKHDHFGFRYPTATNVIETVRVPLIEQNISVLSAINGPVEQVREVKTEKGGRHLIRVPILFTFTDGDTGETLNLDWVGEGVDSEASGVSKALTNGLRTFLLMQFLVPQEHDEPAAGGGPRRAARDTDKITTALYDQLSNAFHTAGDPEDKFADWLDEQGIDVEAGIDPGVRTMTVKQAQDALAFLRGLGTPVEAHDGA